VFFLILFCFWKFEFLIDFFFYFEIFLCAFIFWIFMWIRPLPRTGLYLKGFGDHLSRGSCHNQHRDGKANRKNKTGLKEIWSRHHSYFWKTMENHQNKTSLRKTRFWIRESVTRTEGVSTLQRPPKDDTFN